MTSPHEPVRMRFRGRMKRLPLMSFAAAFGRDVATTARALDTLVQGPPERREPAPLPADNRRVDPPPEDVGGGSGGGERSTMNVNDSDEDYSNVQRSERSATDESVEIASDDGLATMLAGELHDEANWPAIRKLVRAYPRELLLEALRRTKAIAPERIRRSPAAVFTGIARKLAADGWTPPHRPTDV